MPMSDGRGFSVCRTIIEQFKHAFSIADSVRLRFFVPQHLAVLVAERLVRILAQPLLIAR